MSELNHVACVEDDSDIRSIVELALGDLGGMNVSLFENGAAAVAGMEETAPQMILLDVMMPGMDGLETLSRLRAMPALSNTPCVFMTAKAQPSEIHRYVEAGALGVITKPFDPMTLADQVRDFWNGDGDAR